MNEEKIMEKLDEHGDNFERFFKKLDEHSKKLDEHGDQIDGLAREIVGLRSDVDEIKETMVTKADLRNELDGIRTNLDTLVRLNMKKDQEVTVQGHQIRVLRDEMDLVKPLVGLA